MNTGWTPQAITNFVLALASLAGVVFAVVKAFVAETKADTNAANHVAATTAMGRLEDKVHDIAVALPAAVQQLAPAVQQLAAIPQIQPYVASLEPAAKIASETLDAVNAIASQVQQIHAATKASGGKPVTAGLTGAAT